MSSHSELPARTPLKASEASDRLNAGAPCHLLLVSNGQMIDGITMNEKCLKAYGARRFGNSPASGIVGNDGDLGPGWLRKRNNRRSRVRPPQP